MANPRQLARDAWAQAKGFRTYYLYRDWLARQMGYASYTAQRKARKTGIGLKGEDIKAKAKVEKTVARWAQGVVGGKIPGDVTSDLARAGIDPEWMTAALRDVVAKFKAQQHDIRQTLLSTDRSQILASNRKKILAILKNSKEISDEYYKKELPKLYLQGLRAGAGKADVTLTDDDKQTILKAIQRGVTNHLRGLQGIGKGTDDLLPKLAGSDVTDRGRRGLVRREGGKAVVYKDGTRRSYGDWAVATVRAISGTLFNTGFIRGAMRFQDAELFMISDGPECGLREHNDATHADGLIVKAADAMNYPIAHPHCVRSFSVYRGDKKPYETLGEKAKEVLVGAIKASVAASITGTLAETIRSFAAQNDIGQLAQSYLQKVISPRARIYIARMQKVVVPKMDIVTGQVAGYEKISLEDLAMRVSEYQDPFWIDHQQEIPQYIRMVINGDMQRVSEIKWLRNTDNFMEMFDTNFRPRLNILDDFFSNSEKGMSLKDSLYDTFTSIVSKDQGLQANQYLRFSFPSLTRDISRLEPPGVSLNWKSLHLRSEVTKTVQDLRAVGTLNPNGLLRVGFKKSQLGQALTPQLRLVPPGPLHISTTLNRATKPYYEDLGRGVRRQLAPAGRITSVTTRITVTTPRKFMRQANKWLGSSDNGVVAKALQHMGFDVGTTIRMDLRRLNLNSLSDVRGLTMDDFRRLMHPKPDDRTAAGEHTANLFQMVNVITHMRVYGGQFFDMVFTLRLNFREYAQEARMMWELSRLDAQVSGIALPKSPFQTAVPGPERTLWRAKLKSTTPGAKPPPPRPPKKKTKPTQPGTVTDITRRRPQGGPGPVGPTSAAKGPGRPSLGERLHTRLQKEYQKTGVTPIPPGPLRTAIAKRTAELEAKYPGVSRVKFARGGGVTTWSKNVYGETKDGVIHLNPEVVDKFPEFAAKYRDGINRNWVVGNGDPLNLITHEYAHHIFESAPEKMRRDFFARIIESTLDQGDLPDHIPQLLEDWRKGGHLASVGHVNYQFMTWMRENHDIFINHISEYALTNGGEFFAEVFLQSQMGIVNDWTAVVDQWIKDAGFTKPRNAMIIEPGKKGIIKNVRSILPGGRVKNEVTKTLEALYKDLPLLPRVNVVSGGGLTDTHSDLAGHYIRETDTIHLSHNVTRDWAGHTADRMKFEKTGYIPKGTGGAVNTAIHEFGHHVFLQANLDEQKDLFVRLMKADISGLNPASAADLAQMHYKDVKPDVLAHFFHRWMDRNRDYIFGNVSMYGFSNGGELIAELFLQAVAKGGKLPHGPLADIVLNWAKEIYT